MPIKIAIVSQAYHPAVGGVTEHVDATALALRERGHDVTIITARFSDREHAASGAGHDARGRGRPGNGDGHRVLRIGRNFSVPYNGAENNVTVGFGLREKLADIIRRERFDLLHVHCPISPVLPLLTLQVAKQPIVGTFHSTVTSDLAFRLFRRALRPSYRRLDRILAVSEEARACVLRHFPGPVEILPNGVNLERFRPGLKRLERFDDGTPNILFVGRHDPRKGLPELMAACAALARDSVPFRLIVVGDGRLRHRIERMAGGVLQGRVHFEGHVSNEHLPRYYASADVFCSPARGGESFGIVLLEAMAAGVAIVATDLPGYRTVLTPGAQGLAVPPRNSDQLRRALETVLGSQDLRREMGARGVETSRRYAWPLIVEKLEEIYRVVLGGARTAGSLDDSRERVVALEPAQA
ncbi:MAG: glycosyltransferase family 4 protein [Candidatus Eisenbacteria bacterium]|uniref:Glycosyltransferase family 4 protein n=1 Tax=Eiseniibacteriota bacterium TaxID=2212470 RepID=A0A538TER0_UNCEI|nr:MAG: glycosyltransferase family 4 protein [Candidatus Eisenbacteria bacterium]